MLCAYLARAHNFNLFFFFEHFRWQMRLFYDFCRKLLYVVFCRFSSYPHVCVCVCIPGQCMCGARSTHESFPKAKLTFPMAQWYSNSKIHLCPENKPSEERQRYKVNALAIEQEPEFGWKHSASSWSVSWPNNSNNLQLVPVSLSLSLLEQKSILIDSDADRHADMPQKLIHLTTTTTFFDLGILVCFAYKEFCNRFAKAISREQAIK